MMFDKPTRAVRIGNAYRRFKSVFLRSLSQFFCDHADFAYVRSLGGELSSIQCQHCKAYKKLWTHTSNVGSSKYSADTNTRKHKRSTAIE